jgi:hypothetical protein
MRGMRHEIETALAGVSDRILVATRAGVQPWPSTTAWQGGVDAVPALQQAFQTALGPEPQAIVWIAGEQPVSFSSALGIRQMLERTQGRVKLYMLASPFSNTVVRELDGAPGTETVPRLGSIGDDLRRLFAKWQAGRERVVERQLQAAGDRNGAEQSSSHIVRLWAADTSAAGAERNRAAAVALAVAHQIVTPLSGAVVLETAAQYAQNGLQPPSGSKVPTMPEPETIGLLAVGLAVVVWLKWRPRACTS